MAEGTRKEKPRRVVITHRAAEDLDDIFDWNLRKHGFEQAEAYGQFLLNQFEMLGENPFVAQAFDDIESNRTWIAKWPGATYGHRIILFVETTKVHILRVIHTSRNAVDLRP